jgi:flagellar biosynthetic protein FlhB
MGLSGIDLYNMGDVAMKKIDQRLDWAMLASRQKIKINLGFFAEEEKTEQPTERKKKKSRDEGQVAKSQEVSTAFLLLATFFSLQLFAGPLLGRLINLFSFQMSIIAMGMVDLDNTFAARYISWLFQQVLLLAAPIFAVVTLTGVIVSWRQVGWNPTFKPIKPKFSKLNPIKGFKKIFSMQALVNLAKSLLKAGVIGLVVFFIARRELYMIPTLLSMELGQAISYIGGLVVNLGLTVGALYLFIAALDYAYTRWKHNKDLKMTKQEVKDEYKQIEGDPKVKGKIKQKMMEISMRRMMQKVPQADVIITNPTHYAVALKYELTTGFAPIVVAKGVDFQAKRIRELAKEHKVEIIENPPLARAIYDTVPVDKEIPPELYEAVAEILAYVFTLKNKAA